MSQEKIELVIESIAHSQSHNGAYVLFFRERFGKRSLPVVIGPFEAQSIAIALDKEETLPRPITHDLIKLILEEGGMELKEVVIYDYKNNLFYAKLVLLVSGKEISIDCRTSDAVAIAIRVDARVYVYEDILRSALDPLSTDQLEIDEILKDIEQGLGESEEESEGPLEEVSTSVESLSNEDLKELPLEILEKYLDSLIEQEDYEQAAKVRDHITKRKQGKS